MMNFINAFLENDFHTLETKLSLVMIMWLIVLAAIVIDLFSGIGKARRTGVARTSFGLRRTVSKLIQYYSVLLFALMFDLIASLVVSLPYFTMLGSAFLVFIEAKSVYEKAGDKVRRKAVENISDLITLLDNRDDPVKGLSQILKQKQDVKGTEE